VAYLYGWTRLGVHVVPDHRYRVTVQYVNPTGRVLAGGGMGVVGGLFIPDRGVAWPAADTVDSLYRVDYAHYMRLGGGHQMGGMQMPMSSHEHEPTHRHH
jgi:hypothetical protein